MWTSCRDGGGHNQRVSRACFRLGAHIVWTVKIADKYEMIGHIGSGGMGKILLARDQRGQLVVVKMSLTGSEDDDQRLVHEARVGLRLAHGHIVETLDLVHHDGHPALVTAFVSGASLFDLRRRGPMPTAIVCRIGKQIADALEAIHTAADDQLRPLDMLHRDVTPSNIMLGHDGCARLIDLGIVQSRESRAEPTEIGSVRGTIRYLAPELFSGAPHSRATDLWALGVVLWEALLGRDAVEGTAAAAIGRICTGHLMVLKAGDTVHPAMQRAIAQLLRSDPCARPTRARDASALFAMLERDLAGGADLQADAAALVAERVGPAESARDHGRDVSDLMKQAKRVLVNGFEPQSTSATHGPNVHEALPLTLHDALASDELASEEYPELPVVALSEPRRRTAPLAAITGALPRFETPPTTPTEQLQHYARLLASLES